MGIERVVGEGFAEVVTGLIEVYGAAMGPVPGPLARAMAREWQAWRGLPGWRCVAARAAVGGEVEGFALGHASAHRCSWHDLTAVALARAGIPGPVIEEGMRGCLFLAEIHVRPELQGRGIGACLLEEFLDGWPGAAQLTVREDDEEGRAWRLYRRFGFVPLARDLAIAGDEQRFAVMRRGAEIGRT